jgi:hypothetical protein
MNTVSYEHYWKGKNSKCIVNEIGLLEIIHSPEWERKIDILKQIQQQRSRNRVGYKKDHYE